MPGLPRSAVVSKGTMFHLWKTHLSKNGYQLGFSEVGRRFHEVGERDGDMLKHRIVRAFEVEALQHVKEVNVMKSKQHSNLPNGTRAMKSLHNEGIVGFCPCGHNRDGLIEV